MGLRQPVIAPGFFKICRRSGQRHGLAAIQHGVLALYPGHVLEIQHEAGTAQVKALVHQQRCHHLPEGRADTLRIHGAIPTVIADAPSNPFHIPDPLHENLAEPVSRSHHNALAPTALQLLHGAVQCLKKPPLFHRLEKVKEGPDLIAVGGEVVGSRQVDDLSAVSLLPQLGLVLGVLLSEFL